MKKLSLSHLTQRERQFCYNYVSTGNIKDSALMAGYKISPEMFGTKLLLRDDINKNLDILYEQKKKNLIYKAFNGYERLAFGDTSDAIKLICAEDLSFKNIEKMNLFNISEIKKPKEGSMEIKFFDRLKALEKLHQLNLFEEKNESNFYNAIERGVKAFNDDD